MEWHSLHVVYYANDKDRLLLEGVRPLLRRLAPEVAATSFTRHWRLGPHVRIHVKCAPAAVPALVRPAAEEIVGGFLARHPSCTHLVPEDHLDEHRRLAELEEDDRPLLPWRPDNTIHQAPFERRAHVLGSEEVADLLADFHAATADPAFRMTEAVAGGTPRLGLAFDLMVATAHALSGVGITTGFMSFRSHAEAFLTTHPEAHRLRPSWDAHYRGHAASLCDRVGRVTGALDDGSGGVGFTGEWTELMRSFRRRGRALLAEGRLPSETAFAPGADGRPPPLAGASPYHRAAYRNPAVMASMTAEWFVLYRLMLNYTYLFMTQLGVTPVERYLLCHLTAHAVEELYGVSAMEQITRAPPEPVLDAGGEPR
ncbi:hypothetical protein LP52_15650 [Streptomonospora alba]|uniref:Thiopeptide-type bacteriocin biosynthesis domain-containing protein n=1 Tax=Streptomonospora alba TaxID=183763 RepID=A0A0C2G4C4_9ACTN|nr:thiopeptide maturation pyridine synthase [Streptomonospora alba]KIH98113.1 hypothetical protein LP52_15650 [Streptomonospora alba]